MTLKEVQQLRPGDEVYWRDPDGGKCSRHYTIQQISLMPGNTDNDVIVSITDVDGDTLDCFSYELA